MDGLVFSWCSNIIIEKKQSTHRVGVSYRCVVLLFGNANSSTQEKALELAFLTHYKYHVTEINKTQCFPSKEFIVERRNTNLNEERNTGKTTREDI